jgi:hypothetical protein
MVRAGARRAGPQAAAELAAASCILLRELGARQGARSGASGTTRPRKRHIRESTPRGWSGVAPAAPAHGSGPGSVSTSVPLPRSRDHSVAGCCKFGFHRNRNSCPVAPPGRLQGSMAAPRLLCVTLPADWLPALWACWCGLQERAPHACFRPCVRCGRGGILLTRSGSNVRGSARCTGRFLRSQCCYARSRARRTKILRPTNLKSIFTR